MEDILATVLIVFFLAAVVGSTALLVRKYRKHKAAELKRQQERSELIRKYTEKMRTPSPSNYAAVMNKPISKKDPEKVQTPPPTKRETYTAPSTPTRSSDSSDDGFVSGMLTGMLIDNVVNSLSHKSEPSLGVSKTESSWGFDDSDSRKSISDSMSDSWSSSSSSSDSWSSSDSGPSSDW